VKNFLSSPFGYSAKLLLVAILYYVAGYIFFLKFGIIDKFYLFQYLLIFLFFINFITHIVLIKKTEKSPKKFFSVYLISSTARLMLYILAAVCSFFLIKAEIKVFLISFMFLYIGFTFFETFSLMNYFRNKG
jgi:hypothetical protein